MATPKTPARAAPTRFTRPLTSVDVAVFTVMNEQLRVLLVRRPDTAGEPFPARLALPGLLGPGPRVHLVEVVKEFSSRLLPPRAPPRGPVEGVAAVSVWGLCSRLGCCLATPEQRC